MPIDNFDTREARSEIIHCQLYILHFKKEGNYL